MEIGLATGLIWDWVILLIILCCPALAVATETSGDRASRRRFAIALFFWLPLLCVPDILWLFGKLRTDVTSLAMFVLRIIVVLWFYRLTARRVRDVGHQKSIAYLACLPVVNIAFFLYLLFTRGNPDPSKKPANA